MRYSYNEGIGSFSLTDLEGCSQIGVSHGVFLKEMCRGKNYSVDFAIKRLDKARELGYDLLLCTCDESNTPQVKTLTKFNWVKTTVFLSSKTGHKVGLWFKHI